MSPGTLSALLRGSLWPNQIPLPAFAFSRPLLMHEPSVYIVVVCWWFWILVSHLAGCALSISFLVNTLNISCRLLVVMLGSKIMGSWFLWAILFCFFLLGVRSRPSGICSLDGCHLGVRVSSILLAAFWHLCGLLHFVRILSSLHVWQGQLLLGLCALVIL